MTGFVSALGNPWLPAEWNVTVQGQFVQQYGMSRAEEFAQVAGTKIGAVENRSVKPLRGVPIYIFRKTFVVGGGGGLVGAGSSGSGSPP